MNDQTNDIMFRLTGTVTRYKGDGRKLGWPTANIEAPNDTPEGVYAGWTTLQGQRRASMVFIGRPETLADMRKRAESHMFDLEDKDLYGEVITIEVVAKLRDNRKFESLDHLIAAISDDEVMARQVLGYNS